MVVLSAQIPTPVTLFPEDPAVSFRLDGMDRVNWSVRTASDPRFAYVWNVRTPFPSTDKPYDIRLVGTPRLPITKGDTLVAKFWLRTISAAYGQGHTRFVVERNRPPYPKSVEWFAAATAEWTQYQIPFVAAESDDAGGYSAQFWVASGPQEIEIAGFQVYKYGAGVKFSSLNLPNYPYPNSQANASWRTAAQSRIEQIRKGDAVLVLRDPSGKPMANRKFRARLTRHAFGFGTAVDGALLLESSPEAQRYRDLLYANFNRATLENDLKWTQWIQNRGLALRALEALRSHGITSLRGHTMVWPGWDYLPSDIRAVQGNPAEMQRRINAHIQDIATATRGLLTEWDVVNEPYTNRDLQKILGDAEIGRWFSLARAVDPNTKLYLNDFNILAAGNNDTPHLAAHRDLIESLDKTGAPLDGIGLQAHFDQNLTDPERIISYLDRLAAYKKTIQITEFDVNVADEAVQAAYTRDFLTAAFSHPSVDSVTIWGFWGGRIYNQTNAMIRADWTPKPNFQVWRDLIYREWTTDVEAVSSSDGVARVRGFAGDYELTYEDGGKVVTVPFAIEAGKGKYFFQGQREQAALTSGGVVNAASFQAGPLAPGEAVTIFGTGFGHPEISAAAALPLPTFLGDTEVLFDGVPAPLLYSLKNQVSAVVPDTVGATTRVQITFMGQTSPAVTLPVASANPAVFCSGTAPTEALVYNNDEAGHWNSPATPAVRGGIVTFFITGDGLTAPSGTYPPPANPVSVYFGGQPGKVEFAGRILPGVTQLNVRIPATAPAGDRVPLTVRSANVTSPANVTLALR